MNVVLTACVVLLSLSLSTFLLSAAWYYWRRDPDLAQVEVIVEKQSELHDDDSDYWKQ